MHVDLGGLAFRIIGVEQGLGLDTALIASGATRAGGDTPPDLLVVCFGLIPDETVAPAADLIDTAETLAEAMARRGSGRVVFVLSALAAMPMRRFPRFSAQMAAVTAGMRGLAMQLGPKVLVNAVGAGVIEAGALLAGDSHMLTHASPPRAGSIGDVTNAVLFLCDPLNSYTTGQLLVVDGGWTAGYGRNF
jgi:hypothetical protein